MSWIRDRRRDSFFSSKRNMSLFSQDFNILLIFSCLVCSALCGQCLAIGLQNRAREIACEPYILDGSPNQYGKEDICQSSELFCFRSTLFGVATGGHDLRKISLDASRSGVGGAVQKQSGQGNNDYNGPVEHGLLKLLNGRTVSCSSTSGEFSNPKPSSRNQDSNSSCGKHLSCLREKAVALKKVEVEPPQPADRSCPCVEISPSGLDWGLSYLYTPSVRFISVKNTCNASILKVFEPFITDLQFYPCNSSEVLLGPGESVSMCFVYLPLSLNSSTAELVLQTSSGGFLIQVKGFASESPYKIMPLVGLHITSGRWSRNLSLFNPFKETIQLEQVRIWASFIVGNNSLFAEAQCREENHMLSHEFSNMKKWMDRNNGHKYPLVAVQPIGNWAVGPQKTETILDLWLSTTSEGKVSGTLCVQLLREKDNQTEMIMLPLEAQASGEGSHKAQLGFMASVEPIEPCEPGKPVVFSVFLQNSESSSLKIIKISEVTEDGNLFKIKYSEGLLLFPSSVTQIALVTADSFDQYRNPRIPPQCKLHISTNGSASPEIYIPCEDFFQACFRQYLELSDEFSQVPDHVDVNDARTGGRKLSPSVKFRKLERVEADEYVLHNWRSQGITGDLSVIDHHGVFFPIVPIGKYASKFITVKNPSQEPVVMQLILNSGEIVDHCSIPDCDLYSSFSVNFPPNNMARPSGCGFSIAENATTEAIVHPFGLATLGPILFRPSNQCQWKSSALIRNNLSGVEWLSLHGFGGLHSLQLLDEGSEPVRRIEFDLNLIVPLNISPASSMLDSEFVIHGFHKPSVKELHVMNTGNLPTNISRISISGTECQLDGFSVHDCRSFSLEPGESTVLQISYLSDLSSSLVQRDLELALDTGILVIPMKACVPLYMLYSSQKFMLWLRLKKCCRVVSLAGFMFVILYLLLPYNVAFGSLDEFIKGKSKSTIAMINDTLAVVSKKDILHRSVVVPVVGCSNIQDGQPTEALKEGEHLSSLVENGTCGIGSVSTTERTNTATPPSKCIPLVDRDETEPSSLIVIPAKEEPLSNNANLTIQTAKHRGRRRKKKKDSGIGLMGSVEVASNHSEVSTPSSPLSPVSGLTPKQSSPQHFDKDQQSEPCCSTGCVGGAYCSDKNPEIQPVSKTCILEPVEVVGSVEVPSNHSGVSTPSSPLSLVSGLAPKQSSPQHFDQDQQSEPCCSTGCVGVAYCSDKNPEIQPVSKTCILEPKVSVKDSDKNRPVISLPQYSVLNTAGDPLAPQVPCLPFHARALGPTVQEGVQAVEVEITTEDKFFYDIWGNHISWTHPGSKSDRVSNMALGSVENNFNSFFVMGPQNLVTNSRCRSVSFNQGG